MFAAPRLKEMLGANASLGEPMRDKLVALARDCRAVVPARWIPEIQATSGAEFRENPRVATNVPEPIRDDLLDHPAKLLQLGIVSRDGGLFAALFEDETNAREFMRRALVDALNETFKEWSQKNFCPYQVLMLGGDHLLLACRAQFALPFVIHFAKALAAFPFSNYWSLAQERPVAASQPLSIGAGVAIAGCNFPIHRLHALAEQLAASAKRLHRAQEWA